MPDGPYAEKGTQGDLAPGGEPVALSALIEHGVRLEWYEAVAVVRDICQLLRGGDPPEPVPDLRHIWICANGRMAIAPGTAAGPASTEQPVTTLGRLLLSLVEEVRMPVQLRVVALSAASTTPAYTTVEEFSNALAYFERPGEALPIRPVYSRWHALAAERDTPVGVQSLSPTPPPSTAPSSTASPSTASSSTAPPSTAPTPTPQEIVELAAPSDALGLFLPEKKVVTVRGRSVPVFRIAAAAAVILVATLILGWSLSNRSRFSPPAAQAPVDEAASEPIAQSSWLAEDIDLDAARGSSARSSGAPLQRRRSEPAPVVAPQNRSDNAGAVRATPSARQGNQGAQSSVRTEPDLRAVALVAPPGGSTSRTAAPAPATPPAASSRTPAIDERLSVPEGEPSDAVYSGSDKDVEPPILVRPRVSVDPPAVSEREGITVLDLLISQSGRVETVKLASPAQDYREAMIFSAIKTWKFTPAMRDGHPVRYQKRIWIRISPTETIVR